MEKENKINENLAKLILNIKEDEKKKNVVYPLSEDFQKMKLKQQEKNVVIENLIKVKHEENKNMKSVINVHKYYDPKIIGQDEKTNLNEDPTKILEHNQWKKNEQEDIFSYCEDSSIPYYREYEAIFNHLKAQKQKFVDPQFPPQPSSLLAKQTAKPEWKPLVWLRPEQFYQGSYRLFDNPTKREVEGDDRLAISPDDIQQGELGDCYFLSSIASLTEWPNRVKKLFISRKVNEFGIYCVKLLLDGEWVAVYLDDFFPCFDPKTGKSGPAFTRGNGNELWVLLLEKAYSKIGGSYEDIEAGLPREALNNLTGAPTKYVFSDDVNLWNEIVDGERSNFIMTCGTGDSFTQIQEKQIGLIAAHAYSLISAMTIEKDKHTIRLVKLRNPWGAVEWTGNWSDNSPLWTPEIRKQAGFEQSKNDGIFFMDLGDFKKYYGDIQICMYKDDYVYSSLKYEEKNQGETSYFKFKVNKTGTYYITAHQPSNKSFKYAPSHIVVGKSEGKLFSLVGANQKKERELWITGEFQAGVEYVVYSKIRWEKDQHRKVIVSSYGVGKAEFQRIDKKIVPNFLLLCYLSRARKSNQLQNYVQVPQVQKAIEIFEKEGFGYIYIHNGGNRQFHSKMQFNILHGLKLKKPYKGTSVQADVNPMSEFIVAIKVDAKGYSNPVLNENISLS